MMRQPTSTRLSTTTQPGSLGGGGRFEGPSPVTLKSARHKTDVETLMLDAVAVLVDGQFRAKKYAASFGLCLQERGKLEKESGLTYCPSSKA